MQVFEGILVTGAASREGHWASTKVMSWLVTWVFSLRLLQKFVGRGGA